MEKVITLEMITLLSKCGYCIVVVRNLAKVNVRVQFSLSAPNLCSSVDRTMDF